MGGLYMLCKICFNKTIYFRKYIQPVLSVLPYTVWLLTTTLTGRCFYAHFTDADKLRKGSWLPTQISCPRPCPTPCLHTQWSQSQAAILSWVLGVTWLPLTFLIQKGFWLESSIYWYPREIKGRVRPSQMTWRWC